MNREAYQLDRIFCATKDLDGLLKTKEQKEKVKIILEQIESLKKDFKSV